MMTISKPIINQRKEYLIERIIAKPIFWIVLLSFLFGYPIYRSLNRELPPDLPRYFKLPDFEFTNGFDKPYGSKNLKGSSYIASFMFTSCPTTCPRITKKMQLIQKRIRGVGGKVKLVTFSVDPANDTPAVLHKYARKAHAAPHVWSFLTATPAKMKSLLVDGFKVPMGDKEKVAKKLDQSTINLWDIAHTEKVVLVDHTGTIRGYYSLEKDSINKLMIDVGLLINREYWRKNHGER